MEEALVLGGEGTSACLAHGEEQLEGNGRASYAKYTEVISLSSLNFSGVSV